MTDHTYEQFNSVLEINVTGVWLLLKHATPIMTAQKSGSFVAISSGGGVIVFNGLCPYVASKHAVCGMINTACLEFGSRGVHFNVFTPQVPLRTGWWTLSINRLTQKIQQPLKILWKPWSQWTDMERMVGSLNLHLSWLRMNLLSSTVGFSWLMAVSLLDDWPTH